MEKQKTKFSPVFLASAIILAVALGGWWLIKQGIINLPSADNATPAPEFSLEDYEGNTISSADFAGKPIVINSWAKWCPFCVKEIPAFVQAQKELGDKVVIVLINRSESLNVAKSYTDELGVTDDLIYLLDPGDSFYQSLGGFSMPETIFVDSDGNIRFHKRGPMEKEEILELIQTHLLN